MGVTKEAIEQYAPRLSLTRHTGALLMWFQQEYYYRGNPEKLKSEVVSVTIKNLIFGWWSPVSLIINPIVTAVNWVNYSQYKKSFERFIANPEQYITELQQAGRLHQEKQQRRFKNGLIVLSVLVFLIIILVVIASQQ